MCSETALHNPASQRNGCCLNEACDWHGPYMLDGPGWWLNPHNREGTAHCPKCGHGKFVRREVRIDPLIHAAQLLLNREEVN